MPTMPYGSARCKRLCQEGTLVPDMRCHSISRLWSRYQAALS